MLCTLISISHFCGESPLFCNISFSMLGAEQHFGTTTSSLSVSSVSLGLGCISLLLIILGLQCGPFYKSVTHQQELIFNTDV